MSENEPSTALAVIDAPQSLTIFGTNDTSAMTAKVTAVAQFVQEIVKNGHLSKNISGREYVQVEGWEAAGIALGLSAYIVSCEATGPMWENGQFPGFLAVAELRNTTGDVLARAESSCERDEDRWRTRDNYALRSMAQTRATGKVFRQVLGFVMTVAGYAGTPADEMPTDDATGAPRVAGPRTEQPLPPRPAQAKPAPAARPATQTRAPQSPTPAAPSEGEAPPVRTMNQLFTWAQQMYGYDEAKVFSINDVTDKDGLRGIGLTKVLDNLKVYRNSADPRGPEGGHLLEAALDAGAQRIDPDDMPMPIDPPPEDGDFREVPQAE